MYGYEKYEGKLYGTTGCINENQMKKKTSDWNGLEQMQDFAINLY